VQDWLSFGDFTIDRRDERLLGPQGPVRLGNKAFRVLLELARLEGRLVTKDALFSSAWDGTIVSESALTSVIKELRRALGDESKTPRYIESIYGRGYRLLPEVTRSAQRPPAMPQSRKLDENPLDQALERGSQNRIRKALQDNVLIQSVDGEISLNPALFLRFDDLASAPDLARAIYSQNIIYLGDAIERYPSDWRAIGFDDAKLDGLRGIFDTYGLPMGADIPGWPPDDFESHVRRAEAALRTTKIRQARVGVVFEASSDFLVINPAGEETDHKAAEKPAFAQLHSEIIRKARQFGSAAPRLDNQTGWQGINGLCDRLITLLDRPTDVIPNIAGSLYSAALELGSFFEMDREIRRGEDSFAVPLNTEVRRPLEDLLRSLAPWLRNLPSIREMDDEAGQFLVPPLLLDPSVNVIRAAGQTQLISESDADLLRGLLDAANRGEFQSVKARHRSFLSARNMIVAVASLFGGLILADFGAKSVLVGKAGTFLAEAETEIIELVADLPPDLRFAIEMVVRQSREIPILPVQPQPIRTETKRPVRRTSEGEEVEDISGTLIDVNGDWYVRYEGGQGALVPLLNATFAINVVDTSRAYPVFGRLMMSGDRPIGFSASRIVISAAGRG
jgi:DNA-binding winged helix-turn-helix (wHTH) protein